MECYPLQVLPDLFHAVRICEDGLKEFITWKLGTLVSIVRQVWLVVLVSFSFHECFILAEKIQWCVAAYTQVFIRVAVPYFWTVALFIQFSFNQPSSARFPSKDCFSAAWFSTFHSKCLNFEHHLCLIGIGLPVIVLLYGFIIVI